MRKCKGCDADCLFCHDSPEWLEKIDTKGAFLFWPCVVIGIVAVTTWWLS